MQKVFSHLAYLLTKHECVTIPGFGAFVVHKTHAEQTGKEGIFTAPSYQIGFNQDLKYNDALLSGSIVKERHISYSEANIVVQQFCDRLQYQLKSQGEIKIPLVGELKLSEEKELIFIPSNELSSNAVYYGFCNFYLPLLNEIEVVSTSSTKEKVKDKNIIWIPINKKVLSTIASTAAAVLCLLMLSTPIDNEQIPVQYAGVLTSFISSSQLTEHTTTDSFAGNDIGENASEVSLADSTENIILSDPLFSEKESDQKEIQAPAPTHRYYIIIGSFPTTEIANKKLADFHSGKFKNASILEQKGRTRIYIDKFENKNDAEKFLQEFRKSNGQHQDAWIYSEHRKS